MAIVINPRSLYGQIILATYAKVVDLRLEGIEAAFVKAQKFPFNMPAVTEGLFVSPTRETLDNVQNAADDEGFGVQITYAKSSNGSLDFDDDADQLCYHRQRLFDAFLPTQGTGLEAVPEVITTKVEPGPLFDPACFAANFDAFAFVARFYIRQRRQSY